MTRTAPPRPLDVASVFPELAGTSRTATRLHPRPGAPTVHERSVGGPLLWPAGLAAGPGGARRVRGAPR
ncbi:hypothetical protein [Streptomyces sp. NPDC059742]|uniref:hypothetical protein n=1 Tax=Streptomyces sp. NPDC059742 TaxID=3346927 RepID=UPI003647DD68